MKKVLSILFLLAIIVLSACQNKKVVVSHQFEDQKWNAFEKIKLETRITNKENPYRITLKFKIDEKFNSGSFRFGLSQTNDDGESRYSTYELPIKDRLGEIIDKKQSDSLYHYALILNSKTYFNSDSLYYFTFENMMNKLYLEGLYEMSLEMEQLK